MEEKTFEAKEKRLNEICSKMENDNLSISEMVNMYEEGANLFSECISELENAKGKIVKIKAKLDGVYEEEINWVYYVNSTTTYSVVNTMQTA